MTWTGPSATLRSLPHGLLSLPIVAEFSAHLGAVCQIAFGRNSQQRKLS
jgi:hypothetical protein